MLRKFISVRKIASFVSDAMRCGLLAEKANTHFSSSFETCKPNETGLAFDRFTALRTDLNVQVFLIKPTGDYRFHVSNTE